MAFATGENNSSNGLAQTEKTPVVASASASKRRSAALFRMVLAATCAIACLLGCSSCSANSPASSFPIGVRVIVSGSMSPAINKGDLVLIARQDAYHVGDVVCYDSDGVDVTHRIVAIEGDAVTTRGDANNLDDPSFPASQIRGSVTCVIPYIGNVVIVLRENPVVLAALIFVAVALIALDFVPHRRPKGNHAAK